MAKYRPTWYRKPNLCYSIGTECNNSHIAEIKYPTDPSAYPTYWTGHTMWKNPKWMDIVLASGNVITSKELEIKKVEIDDVV